MATVERITAIILERSPLREADRRILVYSREFGKMSLVAKGTQKFSSKLAGSLEPLTEARINITRGRTDRVIGSRLVSAWPRLRRRLGALAAASFVVQVADRLTKPEVADSEIYQKLHTCLVAIDQAEPGREGKAVRCFLWQLLDRLGELPRLDRCARCGGELGSGRRFAPASGGALCARCAAGRTGTLPLTPRLTTVADQLLGGTGDELGPTLDRALARMVEATLLVHLGERLPSERFWRSVKRATTQP